MSAVKTIRQLHDGWAASCLPANASQIQRQEMERAFYSGAFAFFTLMVADIAAMSDADADKAMERLDAELMDYFMLLRQIPGPEGTTRQ